MVEVAEAITTIEETPHMVLPSQTHPLKRNFTARCQEATPQDLGHNEADHPRKVQSPPMVMDQGIISIEMIFI